MSSVSIILSKEKKKNGECRVCIHIIHERKHRELPLGVSILPDMFRDGVVVKQHPHAAKLNSKIAKAKHVANDVLIDHAGQYVQIDELRNIIKARLGHTSKTIPLREFTETIIAELKAQNKGGDAEVKKNAVNAFLRYVDRDILLHEIDYTTLTQYKQHLVKSSLKNSTISNYIRTLKMIWDEAADRSLVKAEKYPFVSGLIPAPNKSEKKAVGPLVIHALEKARPSLTDIQREGVSARLLQFYFQGIDIVDLALIESTWIDEDDYILLNRYKNRNKANQSVVKIKIPPKAKVILNEWIGGHYITPLLNGISVSNVRQWANKRNSIDDAVNRVLRNLGFSEKFGAKAARHTWLTIADSLTTNHLLPIIAVGHSTKSMTAVYIKTDQSLIDDLNAAVINSTSLTISKAQSKAG